MNKMYCLDSDKEALNLVMTREVALMRNLLTSLRDECNAIKLQNLDMFDNVMEERIALFSSFEKLSEKLVELTVKLAKNAEVTISESSPMRHLEALEILQECLNPEDFELLSCREQIIALVDEIYHQNDMNALLIRDGIPHEWLQQAYPREKLKPSHKSVVTVIEE